MATQNKIPVGFNIPLRRGTNGFFQQNFNTLDQAYTNIKNLLLTMTGERRMNVNFGSPIYNLLFEQVTNVEELKLILQQEIESLIKLYFPYVDIKNVEIIIPNYNANQININLTFSLKNSSNTQFGVEETRTVSVTMNTI